MPGVACYTYQAPSFGTRCKLCFQLPAQHVYEEKGDAALESGTPRSGLHLAEFPSTEHSSDRESTASIITFGRSVRKAYKKATASHRTLNVSKLGSSRLGKKERTLSVETPSHDSDCRRCMARVHSRIPSYADDPLIGGLREPHTCEHTDSEPFDSASEGDSMTLYSEDTSAFTHESSEPAEQKPEDTDQPSPPLPSVGPSVTESMSSSPKSPTEKATSADIIQGWKTKSSHLLLRRDLPAACEKCKRMFSWKVRRHQCRVCVKHFCERCCQKMYLPSRIVNLSAKSYDPHRSQWTCGPCASKCTLQDNKYAHSLASIEHSPAVLTTSSAYCHCGTMFVSRYCGECGAPRTRTLAT